MKPPSLTLISKFIAVLAEHAHKLVPLLQILGVIAALAVIGLMVLKGKP